MHLDLSFHTVQEKVSVLTLWLILNALSMLCALIKSNINKVVLKKCWLMRPFMTRITVQERMCFVWAST